ncbi:uncharacterized protein LOC120121905 [Hibiscus syriacus]|uniref:uncharacterized protein LOC120121905 n=1 Tax=Hibiscus syriacus TaxID=106335 RepID=UPI0019226350|nr:uncharacterized protein LOC120121905 [Hibiscus syriacus]
MEVGGHNGDNLMWVWRTKTSERIRFFIWLSYLDKLNTNEVRCMKNMTQNANCKDCRDDTESINHIFRMCRAANFVWEELQVKEQDNQFTSLEFKRDLEKSLSNAHKRMVQDPCLIKWKKPPEGVWILNTDGVYKLNSGMAAVGGLIRDSNGDWIAGFMLRLGRVNSSIAEIWGARQGLNLAKSLGSRNMVLEMDAKWIVDLFNGDKNEDFLEFQLLLTV